MGAVLGIGASLAGGLLSKSSKNKEARRITAAGKLGAEQFSPFQEAGADANQQILSSLSGGAGSQEAFQNFLGSTGFQSQLQAGSQAITGNQAASGLLQSGSTLKRLNTFGQDLGQQGFTNFLGQLGGVAQRGLGAAQGASNALTGTGVQAAQTQGQGSAGFQSGLGQAVQQGINLLPAGV